MLEDFYPCPQGMLAVLALVKIKPVQPSYTHLTDSGPATTELTCHLFLPRNTGRVEGLLVFTLQPALQFKNKVLSYLILLFGATAMPANHSLNSTCFSMASEQPGCTAHHLHAPFWAVLSHHRGLSLTHSAARDSDLES